MTSREQGPDVRANMSPEDRLIFDLFASTPMFLPAQNPTGRVKDLLEDLPRLTEADLDKAGQKEGACSVCYTTFLAILAEEEYASVMQSPAHPSEELGVTKLTKPWQCGHIFCRKDITKWIREGKDSCPMCRKTLLDPSLPPAQPRMQIFEGAPELQAFYREMGMDADIGSAGEDPANRAQSSNAGEYSSMFS